MTKQSTVEYQDSLMRRSSLKYALKSYHDYFFQAYNDPKIQNQFLASERSFNFAANQTRMISSLLAQYSKE